MRIEHSLVLGLALVVSCAGQQHAELTPDRGALLAVHRIYLGTFGNIESSDLVKEKVRIRLINSGRFEVAEDSARADAILTGSAGIDRSTDRGTTDYRGIGLLRLVLVQSQRTIWAHEYKRGRCFGCSVSTRVADQMVDQLLTDAQTGP